MDHTMGGGARGMIPGMEERTTHGNAPQRDLRPAFRNRLNAASRVPWRGIRFQVGRRARQAWVGGGGAGLAWSSRSPPAYGGSVGLFSLRIRIASPAPPTRRLDPHGRRVGKSAPADPLRSGSDTERKCAPGLCHGGGEARGAGQDVHVVRGRQSAPVSRSTRWGTADGAAPETSGAERPNQCNDGKTCSSLRACMPRRRTRTRSTTTYRALTARARRTRSA